jgi:uncharacterized SAM-binding protein YcdF (DUF218 family)
MRGSGPPAVAITVCQSRSRLRRRWLSLATAGAVLLFASYASAIGLADRLLVVRTAPTHTDVIVVLGGDWRGRADHAAALFRAGLAPRILASGAGDCREMRRKMIEDGVPLKAIAVECASRSTIQNAAISAPILAAIGARSALLVTSWFHTRRALASFQKEIPEIRWASAPVARNEALRRLIWNHDGFEVAEEYPKLLYYWIRYGVSLKPGPEAAEAEGAESG